MIEEIGLTVAAILGQFLVGRSMDVDDAFDRQEDVVQAESDRREEAAEDQGEDQDEAAMDSRPSVFDDRNEAHPVLERIREAVLGLPARAGRPGAGPRGGTRLPRRGVVVPEPRSRARAR